MAEPKVESEEGRNTTTVWLYNEACDDVAETGSQVYFPTIEKSAGDRKCYSYIEKMNILKKVNIESVRSITEEYKISDRTLRRWRRGQDKIVKMCNKKYTQNRKRIKQLLNKDLDRAVHIWFCQALANGTAITGPMIRKRALRLNIKLGGPLSFKASEGWLDKWKSRMNIKAKRVPGGTFTYAD